jgi:nitrogen fixation protein FixH
MTPLMPPTAAEPGFVLKGWHVGSIVVAFFAAVVGVDVSMAIQAYSTFPGEVTAKPYEEGIGFNGEIHRRAAARALGWKARLADRRDGADVVFEAAIRDAAGQPVRGLHPAAVLTRTVTTAGARKLVFTETAPGTYVARTPATVGLWTLDLSARGPAGADFEMEQRLVWP